MEAILDGAVDRVRTLLFFGRFSLESMEDYSLTQLELACRQKGAEAVEIVELLLAHNADEVNDDVLFGILFQACTWSGLTLVAHLADLHPNSIFGQNDEGENLLHASVRNYSAGPRKLSFFLKNYEMYKFLWAKNQDSLEPHVASHRISCTTLKIIILNGGDFNRAKKCPSFAQSCAGMNFCPMRLAETFLSLFKYKFDTKVSMELDFHETHNQLPRILTEEVRLSLDEELGLLKTKYIYAKKTAFQFLICNRLESNWFARNVKAFDLFLLEQPIFYSKGLIKSKLVKSLERLDLFEESRKKFTYIIGYDLPELIIGKILFLLANNELIKIVTVELENKN